MGSISLSSLLNPNSACSGQNPRPVTTELKPNQNKGIYEYRGDGVSGEESSSHSEGRQIGAATTEVNDVEYEEDDESEADWDREDESLV